MHSRNRAALSNYTILWLVRPEKGALIPFVLSVQDFRELKFNAKDECFSGTIRGDAWVISFDC